MQCFKNILVGIDLTRGRRFDVSEIAADAREVINHAIWLAKVNGAKLLFFAALNISQDALHHLQEEEHSHVRRTVEELANRVLAELVAQAGQQGVEARSQLVLGSAWLEIIRQVLRGRHDLLVVGTRDRSGLRRMLFGSTATKLLRRCPCPVWVVKPGHGGRPLNTLIATTLRPEASALRMGVAVGSQMRQPVHVLHVVEYALDQLWGTAYPDRDTTEYHRKVRADAEEAMQERLQELNPEAAGVNVQVHLAEGIGVPDVAIQQFIAEHHIDLLVMGTIGRGGMEGILIGNTAERLLPEVDCSVLAVKPPDFISPVKLDAAEAV
jgi:universal stress protein E